MKINGLPKIPTGYELVPEAFEQRTGEGWMYCMSGDEEWSKCDSWWGVKEHLVYIRPVVTTAIPIETERPLLTPQDFIKDGPWWLKFSQGASFAMVIGASDQFVDVDGPKAYSYKSMRLMNIQRSNDGVNWEDC